MSEAVPGTEILGLLRRAVGSARERLVDHGPVRTKVKAPQDIVTSADLLADRCMGDLLRAECPQLPVMSEESWDSPTLDEIKDGFVVDPLDGTKCFARGLPWWGISACWIQRGTPRAAVVSLPGLAEHHEALVAHGRQASVRMEVPFSQSVVAVGFTHDHTGREASDYQVLRAIMDRVQLVLRTGCASYNLVCVATGRMDGFVMHRMWPYDFLAGALLVEMAGGHVYVWNTHTPRPGMIAGSPEAARELLDIVRKESSMMDIPRRLLAEG